MRHLATDDRGLFQAMVGDGRPLLLFTGVALILSGGFAIFQSATGHFLPHDVDYLGMTAKDLCHIDQCRIVHFMFHDRVSFGGSLIAIGSLYMWLTEFPLRNRQPWAWWLMLLSAAVGFASFLTYLGYGYLDTWHGVATLLLMPFFAGGLYRSYFTLPRPTHPRALVQPGAEVAWQSRLGVGRACLLLTSIALVIGGLTIMIVGMTRVFVPQDLEFMRMTADQIRAINPRLVPLIAHDRAGFGGGLCSTGVTVFFCIWCGSPSRSLWQVLCVAGTSGFGTAIAIHPIVGYDSVSHLAPAVTVAMLLLVGLILTFTPMMRAQGLRLVSQPVESPTATKETDHD